MTRPALDSDDCGVDPDDPDYLDYQEAWEYRQCLDSSP